MYGWRGRIGFLIAGGDRVVEAEAPRLAPEGVECHFTRLPRTEFSQKGISEMVQTLETAVQLLAGTPSSAGVDAICLAHATASSVKVGGDRELIDRIRSAAGVQATTTFTAIVEALRALKVKKVAAVLPYTMPERNTQLTSFLEGNGFHVDTVTTGQYIAGHEISSQPPSSAYRLIKQADTPTSDAVIMTITNFRTIEVIELLEKDLGKPVVTGNQAMLWHCLRLLGISESIKGFGTLLREKN